MGAHHRDEIIRRRIAVEMDDLAMTAFNDALAELDAEIAHVTKLREDDQAAATDAVRARTSALRDARSAVSFDDSGQDQAQPASDATGELEPAPATTSPNPPGTASDSGQ